MESAADTVDKSISEIPGAVRKLEAQYLTLQESLAGLGPAARELVERGSRLVALASGRDKAQSNFERAVKLIKGVLGALERIQASLSDLLPGLRQAAANIRGLRRIQQDLAESIAPLDSIQIMLRIESARLTEESLQAFAALTSEIAALCSRAKNASAENMESIADLDRSIEAALSDMERQRARRERLLETKEREMEGALAQISLDMQRNAHKNLEITAETAGLEEQVSRAVVALQTQDIVAQRLQHSREGLADATAAARGFARKRELQEGRRARAILRVEDKQLESAVEDLGSATEALDDGICAIHRHLKAFDEGCLTMREFSEITASVNGTVQVLLDNFTTIGELLEETTKCVEEIEAVVRPCESMARRATSAVEEIAITMRIISLNAQIHAIQIGESTGLEVLAAHASSIAASTTEIGTRAREGSEKIAGLLAGSLRSAHELLERCTEAGEQLRAGTLAEQEVLHAFRDAALSEVREIGGVIQRARQFAGRLAACTESKPALNLVAEIRAAVLELDHRIGAGRAWEGGDIASFAEDLRRDYSMGRERDVHNRALGLAHGAEGPAGATVAGTVELF